MANQSLPIKPHFFQPLLPDFRTHLNIPVAFFTKHVEGRNDQNKTAKLRSDVSDDKTWSVKMDGLKFTDGWEDFAFAHDLRTGDIVVFRHEGEMVFHVTALGPSCCEIQYTSSHNIQDDSNDQTNIASGNSSRKQTVKKNPRKKVESSSDPSCFEGTVNPSSIHKLYLPKGFVSTNGLHKRCSEIVLKNEQGREWPVVLKYFKSSDQTFLKKGWSSFCQGNGIKDGDSYKFKLVGTLEKPVLFLCPKESNHDKTPLECPDDVKSLSSNPRSGDDCRKSEESEEERIEDNNIPQERLEIKKRKYRSRYRASLDNMDDGHTNTGDSSRKKRVKQNPIKKVESSSDQSSFVSNVTVSSLKNDRLYLPLSFARSNGLDKMSGKRIVLLDEEGRSWKFSLKYNSKYTYARPGWRNFCAANEMSQGQQYMFKLVEKSGTPVMRLCLPERPKSERPKSESSLQHSYFLGSVTASSLKNDQLCLWKNFVSSNGLDKGCKKIVLKNEWGRKWTLVLRHYKIKTILTHGWISFCQVNGLKTGDSFKFKLVGTGEQPVLYLCPAESNRDKTPLECPEGSDDVKSLSLSLSCGDDSSKSEESEKESTEDKNISQGFVEIKKRKYFSSCRASSSYSQSQFVTLTLTPSAFRSYRLYLPRYFTEMNGINKPGKITLLSQDGVKRVVDLFQQNGGIMRFGKGWREFCKAHGVKIDESFVLELIWEDEASPVLKFCTKVNST